MESGFTAAAARRSAEFFARVATSVAGIDHVRDPKFSAYELPGEHAQYLGGRVQAS